MIVYVNTLKNFYKDGEMYFLPVRFYTTLFAGDKEKIGDRTGWTSEEFVDWLGENEDVNTNFPLTKDNILGMCLQYSYDGGNKWIAIAYDMDMSWGLYWDGSFNHLGAPNVSRKSYEDMAEWAAGTTTQYDQYGEPVTYTRGTDGNLLYVRLEKMFKNELRERYRELRKNVLSTGNIISIFDAICS